MLLTVISAMISVLVQPEPHEVAGQGSTPPSDEIVVGLREVYGGLRRPTHLTNAGDGSKRLFVSELAGRVRVATDSGVLSEPFLDLQHLVASGAGEQGFFGTVFHPRFPADKRVFVAYTRRPDGAYVLESFSVSDDVNRVDPASRQTLLVVEQPSALHNGGGLAFGPDGYLYVGLGDGGPGGDPNEYAQNPTVLLGKILRLDVDVGTGYAIPPDNPFVGLEGHRPEIWALGLRNPWRLEFDPLTGDMFIGDVGSGNWEEIDVQAGGSAGGQNYGWPIMEGSSCWPPTRSCDTEGFTSPATTYSHDFGCSVSGGHVYRGNLSPAAAGSYLYADWCSGNIWLMRRNGSDVWSSTIIRETDLVITSFGVDEAGELYVVDFYNGRIYRLWFYQLDPSISISGTLPSAVYNGQGGLSLTVRGTGFTESSIVHWAGRELHTVYRSEHELLALLSAEDATYPLSFDASRQVEVVVANAGANPTTSAAFHIPIEMFAHPAFQRTWERTDALVAAGDAVRTWMWGPTPLTGPVTEPYAEALGGSRVVQYYDKTRMEFTDPDADQDSIWAVTNGLLVVELISGRVQVGDGAFVERQPSQINVAGDQGSQTSPVYATFAELLEPTGDATGAIVAHRISRDGTLTFDRNLAARAISYQHYDEVNGHNIAEPFWEFMNADAPVYVDGEQVQEKLFANPYFATGRPITEAYWTEVPVNGLPELVLLQCFERRCLTYTAENDPGWRVEAGNVGRHYYDWRYANR